MKPDVFYQMRTAESVKGLVDMINHINRYAKVKDMTMVEIGSYIGESTTVFSEYFDKVISIDPFVNDYDPDDMACSHADFSKVYAKFVENTSGILNIVNVRDYSDNVITMFSPGSIDFVYIDGCHTYEQVKKDILNYLPLIKDDGFIGGHDYSDNWPGVVAAITEVLGEVDIVFEDGNWINKKGS